MNQKFYMLYKIGGQGPTYRHSTYESALTEAKRLAKETGGTIVILEAKNSVKVNDFIIEDFGPEVDMPF